MKNIEDINKAAIQKITANKKITEFSPGDTIKVGVKIVEGKRERIQYFEGVCIAKKNRDLNSSFTVRKISFGEGVERTFALYSPNVDSIKVILLEAIDAGGTSLRNHIQPGGEIGYFIQSLQVYGRSGEPCLHCGSILKELKQSGRTTFYCSLCQR